MQKTITTSYSVTLQYLSQLPALNANYVNLLVITYSCRLKIKFDLITTNICFLTNFTELELTNVQTNYWRGQMHCGPPNQNLGGAMAPVAPSAAPPHGVACYLATTHNKPQCQLSTHVVPNLWSRRSMWAERERRKSAPTYFCNSCSPAPFSLRDLPLRPPLRSAPLGRFSVTPAHRSAPPDFRLAPLRASLQQ